MSEGTYYENPRGRAYTTAMGMETGDVTDDEDEGLHDAFDAPCAQDLPKLVVPDVDLAYLGLAQRSVYALAARGPALT
eukprot:1314304-Rhodomonas_salina.6